MPFGMVDEEQTIKKVKGVMEEEIILGAEKVEDVLVEAPKMKMDVE